MNPLVCAVVVTYNRQELLKEALQALKNQSYPLQTILVVNNASTDQTQALLAEEFPELQALHLAQNVGGAGGFYEGLRWAYPRGYEYFWLLDDDSIADPKALETLLEAWENLQQKGLKVGALGSWVVWSDGRPHPMNHPWPNFRQLGLQSMAGSEHRLVRWTTFVGALIPKQAVEQYGFPHPEYFIWNDDLEYTGRIARHQVVAHVKASRIVHKTVKFYTPAASAGSRFYYEVRNRLWVLQSPAFSPLERLLLSFHLLGSTAHYLWVNRRQGWEVVQKGLRDGLSKAPAIRRLEADANSALPEESQGASS